MTTTTATILITALDRASAPIRRINDAVGRLNKSMTQLQLMGFRGLAVSGVVAAGPLRALTQTNYEFSESQNALQAVIQNGFEKTEEGANRLKTAMTELQQEALKAAEATRFDAVEVTQAQMFLARAGLNAEQVQGATGVTTRAASAMRLDNDFVADKLTNTALSFGFKMDGVDQTRRELGMIGDQIAFVSTQANVSGEQAFESLKSLGPIAVAIGSDLSDMLSMVGALGDKGIQGAEAGVALRSTYGRLMAPVKKVQGVMAQMGLDFDNFTTSTKKANVNDFFATMAASGTVSAEQLERSRGAIEAIFNRDDLGNMRKIGLARDAFASAGVDGAVIADAAAEYSASLMDSFDFQSLLRALEQRNITQGQAAIMFGLRHQTKMMALIQGLDKMDEIEARLRDGDAQGALDLMNETQMQGVFGAIEKLRAAWSNLMITLGNNGAADIITKIADSLKAAADGFGRMSAGNQQAVLATMMFGAVIPPVLIAVGMMGQGIAVLTGALMSLSRVLFVIPGLLFGVTKALTVFAVRASGVPVILALITTALAPVRLAFYGAAAAAMFFGKSLLWVVGLKKITTVAVSGIARLAGVLFPLGRMARGVAWAFRLVRLGLIALGAPLVGVTIGLFAVELRDRLGELLDLWRKFKSHIGPLLQGVLRVWRGFWQDSGEEMRRGWIMIEYSLKRIKQTASEALSIVGEELADAIFGEERVDRALTAMSRIADGLNNFRLAVVSVWEDIAKVFFGGVNKESASEGLRGVIDAVQERLVGLLEWAAQIDQIDFVGAVEGFDELLIRLRDFAALQFGNLKEALAAAKESAGGLLEKLRETEVGAWVINISTDAIAAAREKISEMYEHWSSMSWGEIGDKIVAGLEGAKESIVAWAEWLKETILAPFRAVQNAISNLIPGRSGSTTTSGSGTADSRFAVPGTPAPQIAIEQAMRRLSTIQMDMDLAAVGLSMEGRGEDAARAWQIIDQLSRDVSEDGQTDIAALQPYIAGHKEMTQAIAREVIESILAKQEPQRLDATITVKPAPGAALGGTTLSTSSGVNGTLNLGTDPLSP